MDFLAEQNDNINKLITQKLMQIEHDAKIKILFACESGSRAWGFASPNSDFDVRFIYRHTQNSYLSIFEPESQLTFPIDKNEIDLAGWDLKKCLQLLKKSNSALFEWVQSPTVYFEQEGFKKRFWAICPSYFDQKSNIHHYLGIANSALKSTQAEHISIKKLFYVLRPLLAAKWCMNHDQIAPMTFSALMPMLPNDFHDKINYIIQQKQSLPENHPITIDAHLMTFIHNTINDCRTFSNHLTPCIFDDRILNDFFKSELEHDH